MMTDELLVPALVKGHCHPTGSPQFTEEGEMKL